MTIKLAIPILPALDVQTSLDWWTTIAGFTLTFTDRTPPTYAGIASDGTHLHIASVTDPEVARLVGSQIMVRIVVADIHAFYADYQQRGGKIHPNGALATKPWGTTEFATLDPNGICVYLQNS
jgi:uncharacterized glyoxalase superfamily protein PhnB